MYICQCSNEISLSKVTYLCLTGFKPRMVRTSYCKYKCKILGRPDNGSKGDSRGFTKLFEISPFRLNLYLSSLCTEKFDSHIEHKS